MVLFIFPVIFIVLMGPAVVSIVETFGGMWWKLFVMIN
jgi:tight adherence protein C